MYLIVITIVFCILVGWNLPTTCKCEWKIKPTNERVLIMAKKYRVKDKNGKDKVNAVFADYDMAGRQKYRADGYLKGLTPEQHCKQK